MWAGKKHVVCVPFRRNVPFYEGKTQFDILTSLPEDKDFFVANSTPRTDSLLRFYGVRSYELRHAPLKLVVKWISTWLVTHSPVRYTTGQRRQLNLDDLMVIFTGWLTKGVVISADHYKDFLSRDQSSKSAYLLFNAYDIK